MNISERLKKPFPADRIHWRIGARTKDKSRGIPLAYIDARDVMQRLDDICEPHNWQCRYTHADRIVVCEIGIRESVFLPSKSGELNWLWKANGAGETQVEGEKGGCSDALKRAAVLWGIGQYLYQLPNVWVDLDERGNFTPPELPWWALPENWERVLELKAKREQGEASE